MNEDLFKKAQGAQSAAELKTMAAAAGMELTDEQAEAYYAQLHKSGALSDEELDNVAGGGCSGGSNGPVVMAQHLCEYWACKKCGGSGRRPYDGSFGTSQVHTCTSNFYYEKTECQCSNCKYITTAKGITRCSNPANMK